MYRAAAATAVAAILAALTIQYPLIVLGTVGVAVASMFVYLLYRVISNRQAAFPKAHEMLQTRIQKGMALRTAKYDLYLPPLASKHSKAFLFLPGALVDHTAYAGLAIQLAEQHGIVVGVVSLEPTRLASARTGYTTPYILNIAKEIEKSKRKSNSNKNDQDIGGDAYEWSLGGHSMGGYLGALAFPELKRDHAWQKMVCLGAGVSSDPECVLNPQNTLLVQASGDGFLLARPHKYHDGTLEKSCTLVKIQGGNHAGVAHYGPQLYPVKDGESNIPIEQQQEMTATAIANFLL